MTEQNYDPIAVVPRIGSRIVNMIESEVIRSDVHEQEFHSLHEAYAVILEELDEVWSITLQKRRERNPRKLEQELIQVAAMAVKAIHSMHNFVGGDV